MKDIKKRKNPSAVALGKRSWDIRVEKSGVSPEEYMQAVRRGDSPFKVKTKPHMGPNPIKEGSRDRVREDVRIRDKRTCQMCHKVWKTGTRRLDVHHLDEEMEGMSSRKGAAKWDRANMDRMITLCHRCHLNLDGVRKKMASAHNNRLTNIK